MMWRLQAVSAQQKALVTNPIKSVVYRHAGPVHAVSASPFDPSLALSCGLDGQVRICSSLFRQPVVELAPSDSYLFAAQWSPTRPLLVAVGAGWLAAHLIPRVYAMSARKGLPVLLVASLGSVVWKHQTPLRAWPISSRGKA